MYRTFEIAKADAGSRLKHNRGHAFIYARLIECEPDERRGERLGSACPAVYLAAATSLRTSLIAFASAFWAHTASLGVACGYLDPISAQAARAASRTRFS